jgi:hypothetical protein
MNTKGIPYAHAKKIVFLLALIASVPVFAQVDQLFRENISIAPADGRVSSGIVVNSALASSASYHRWSGQKISYLSVADNSDVITREPGYVVKPESNIDFVVEENPTKELGNSLEISFRPTSFVYPKGSGKEVGIHDFPAEKLLLYAAVLKKYALKNGFDTTYAFFSNMGMLSSKKRFFVINLVTMEVQQSGLVSQGRGQGRTKYDKQYSNLIESKCTSLGRYKISNKYKGVYGASYKLIGLDSSNHNAFKRHIVLHPMGCIPDEENRAPACISEGCPAVSPNFLSGLSKIIDTRKKPVLLWVFDSNLEEVIAEEIPAKDKFHTCSIHHRVSSNQP